MDILLCADAALGNTFRHALRAAWPQGRWLDDAPGLDRSAVEVAVVANPPPGRLQGLPRLRLIQSLWAGVDRLLADDTLPRGVPVARMVDPVMTEAMVQTALWAVLSLHRGFFDYARAQREQAWRPHAQRRAGELRVGVLGLGAMGRAVAARLAAQGYPVAGWSLHDGPALAGLDRHAGADALRPLLARCDVAINLLPLTPATRGLLDARAFAALPRGAGLVNLARGAHVVDADLLAALDAGQVGHAVLDVFHTEPLPAGHAYWTHPRVTVLPHAAALTDARSAAQVVAANLDALQRGAPLAHLVERDRGY